jgi:hypothetical protein
MLEPRNGSHQAMRQWVWGTRYVDEVLFMDVNGSPATYLRRGRPEQGSLGKAVV